MRFFNKTFFKFVVGFSAIILIGLIGAILASSQGGQPVEVQSANTR